MSEPRLTLTQRFYKEMVEYKITSLTPFTRKEVKEFRTLFFKRKDANKEKLAQYHRAINRFVRNNREFMGMLKELEKEYRTSHLKSEDKVQESRLSYKDEVVMDSLYKLYAKRRKLENSNEEIDLRVIASIKKKILLFKKVHSDLYADLRKRGDRINRSNIKQKQNFIDTYWSKFNVFFAANPVFHENVVNIVTAYLRDKYNITEDPLVDYSLREDFFLFIRDRKEIVKRLKAKEVEYKKALSDKISKWVSPFFPSVITNADLDIKVDNFTFSLTFNIRKLYENIFNFFSGYYGKKIRLKETFRISKDKIITEGSINPFLIIFFRKSLEEANPSLVENDKVLFTYEKSKNGWYFQFHFRKLIKDMILEFMRKKEAWRKTTPPSYQIHEKSTIIEKLRIQIILPIAAIIIIILVVTSLFFNIQTVNVEKYDSVKIDYIVWESDEGENYDELDPVVDVVLWVTMISITENDSVGLVLGLYNNLLGRGINYDSGLVWLNKCIDQNRDGTDDITGQPALTYGNSTDQYFNTCLMIKFKILDIEKYSPSSSLDPEKNIILYILGYVGISIAGLLTLILAIFYGSRYLQKRKVRPKLVSKKPATRSLKVFKYGLLAALLPAIGVITISIINVVTPFSGILLSNKYNPFVLPVVIGFIITIWALSIPIYFVIFGLVHRKIQKKRKTDT